MLLVIDRSPELPNAKLLKLNRDGVYRLAGQDWRMLAFSEHTTFGTVRGGHYRSHVDSSAASRRRGNWVCIDDSQLELLRETITYFREGRCDSGSAMDCVFPTKMADRAPPPNSHPPAHPQNNRPPRYNPLARPEGHPPRGHQGQAHENLDRENPGMPEQNQERPGESYLERLIRMVNEAMRNHRELEQIATDPAILEVARHNVREQIARARIVEENLDHRKETLRSLTKFAVGEELVFIYKVDGLPYKAKVLAGAHHSTRRSTSRSKTSGCSRGRG